MPVWGGPRCLRNHTSVTSTPNGESDYRCESCRDRAIPHDERYDAVEITYVSRPGER